MKLWKHVLASTTILIMIVPTSAFADVRLDVNNNIYNNRNKIDSTNQQIDGLGIVSNYYINNKLVKSPININGLGHIITKDNMDDGSYVNNSDIKIRINFEKRFNYLTYW
ncbi:hypothetical protein G7084_03645 [Weissella coleopterorum]|uniref:Uncharacterized protein n=1 Tax=Weissella coleopterorum TaxID=2714949 RepID=A0A6G8AZU5_9LACO|nr:hypothetical protein [Weissella coleopterorum]QIL50489.1 hypothetical protein G7084_03645 [Weissella coleopterorum]